MTKSSIDIKPLAGALGAEILGVDLAAEVSNDVYKEINQAFLDHLVIFFRDQTLSPAQFTDVAKHFGTPGDYPFIESIEGHPEVIEILKTEDDTINFGCHWHTDTTYMEKPSLGTMLYALEIPVSGGDTLFANMYKAYEALSDGMKYMLDGLQAVNSSEQKDLGGRAQKMAELNALKDTFVEESESLEAVHPVVRTHPETKKKSLYVNGSHTVNFVGMSDVESKPILAHLFEHMKKPEFQCRFRWAPGSIALWDNRCAQHLAINDYNGQRRRMHRITLEGDRPK
jgi:taurine dioxygenase